MTNADETLGHIDVGRILNEGRGIYKETAVTIWVVTLILIIPAGIIRYLAIESETMLITVLSTIVSLVFDLYLVGALVRVVEEAEEEGSAPASSAAKVIASITPKLVPLLVLGIIYSVCFMAASAALLIPGIFLATVWSVCVTSMIVEDLGVFQSFRRSYELTKGNRWRVLQLGVVFLIIAVVISLVEGILHDVQPIIGSIAFAVIAVLFYPYGALIRTVLFFDLREAEDAVLLLAATTSDSPQSA